MPEVFSNGGFDLIIGNPPYVFARGGSFEHNVKGFFKSHYQVAQYQLNTYALFIERAFQLLKDGGYLAFIVPNTWLTIQTYSTLRKFLLENSSSLKVINVHDKVFSAANVDTCLLIAKKGRGSEVILGEFLDGSVKMLGNYKQEDFSPPEFVINITLLKNVDNVRLLDKINSYSLPLSEFAEVKAGLKAYEVGKGKPRQTDKMKNQRIYHANQQVDSTYRKYLEGKDVKRFHLKWNGQWLKYGVCLAAPRDPELFEGPRILVRQIPSRPPYSINALLTDADYLNDINSMIVRGFRNVSPEFILGILNSRLTTYWFVNTFDKFQRKTFPQFKVNELASFPILNASEDDQQRVEKLVTLIQQSHEHMSETKEGSARFVEIMKHVEELNISLDVVVYDIARLSKAERSIIENSTSTNQ